MKHAIFILLAGILTVIPVQAGWIKTYGIEYNYEWGMKIQQTSDGGFVVFGNISSGPGSNDMWLVKTDAQGDTQWTKTYGGVAPDYCYCYCYSGQQTFDGGYIIAGITESLVEGNADIWFVKTNAVGDTQWTKTYGGTGYDEAYSIQQTDDGGYIITGSRDGPDWRHPGDMWLLKTDSDGDTLWTKTWAAENPTITDVGNCVSQTPDGGYIIACNADFSSVTHDGIVVMKTDDKGDTVWAYRDTIWFMECVAQTTDDAYVATGFNNHDMFLIKLDSEGTLLWKKVYGDAKQDYRDFGWCVQANPDGGGVVAGQYSYNHDLGVGDAWLLKFDSEGDTSWTRTYDEDSKIDEAYWVQPTSDGGYILTGRTETGPSGEDDLFIIKTDSQGYVAVHDNPISDIEDGLEVLSPIGREIMLRYDDRPDGFHAHVFDAAGRKVADIDYPASSGTVTWGNGASPGVYFIRLDSGKTERTCNVVIME